MSSRALVAPRLFLENGICVSVLYFTQQNNPPQEISINDSATLEQLQLIKELNQGEKPSLSNSSKHLYPKKDLKTTRRKISPRWNVKQQRT